MYQYNKNHIKINNYSFVFEYDIRTVLQYKEYYLVLVDIPVNKNDINNIYCLDSKANIVWQAEDLEVLYPQKRNLPYEEMQIQDEVIFASDFYGRIYKINVENGKIEGYSIVK